MSKLARINFIRNPAISSKVLGANNDIRIAIVGLRKKGIEHIDIFRRVPGVRIVALCDVDTTFIDLEAAKLSLSPLTTGMHS